MLIFDEHTTPIIIDNIRGPVVTSHVWVLDLNMHDFTLAPLTVLEEICCPSVQILINQMEIILPANWHILVYDGDTGQLDVVELADTASREFTAFAYGNNTVRPIPMLITMTNYYVQYVNVGPMLQKHQMLCHPIGENLWCCVSPADGYNKYLKEQYIYDLI